MPAAPRHYGENARASGTTTGCARPKRSSLRESAARNKLSLSLRRDCFQKTANIRNTNTPETNLTSAHPVKHEPGAQRCQRSLHALRFWRSPNSAWLPESSFEVPQMRLYPCPLSRVGAISGQRQKLRMPLVCHSDLIHRHESSSMALLHGTAGVSRPVTLQPLQGRFMSCHVLEPTPSVLQRKAVLSP